MINKKEFFKKKSLEVADWLQLNYVLDACGRTFTADIYKDYVNYCAKNNILITTRRRFGQDCEVVLGFQIRIRVGAKTAVGFYCKKLS